MDKVAFRTFEVHIDRIEVGDKIVKRKFKFPFSLFEFLAFLVLI